MTEASPQGEVPATFGALLDALADTPDRDGDGMISIAEILATFGQRAYGPAFCLFGLLQVLPTGLIPLVTDAVAACILVLAIQLLFGAPTPWLPGFLVSLEIDPKRLADSVERARPWAAWADRWTGRRLAWFAGPASIPVVALANIVAAAGMFVLGFVPGLAVLPALTPILCGFGLAARDGALNVLGILIAGAGGGLSAYAVIAWL